MCGIVGCIGDQSVLVPVINGLKALEYRGYDSAGITAVNAGKAYTVKQVGRVETLDGQIQADKNFGKAQLAIGHTRWATHGSPTKLNAHPHTNADQTIFIVHNGIIENYQHLKQKLEKIGYQFVSETDTEVIPHLIDYHLRKFNNFYKAFTATLKELQGAYAIAAIYSKDPDTLYAARLSSPLIIGVGDSCHYIASDPTAIIEHTKKVIFLNDYEVAVLTKTKAKIHNIKQEAQVSRQTEELDFDVQRAQLGDFPHFMLKEIYEAPQTIQSATRGRIRVESSTVKLGGLENVAEQLRYIDRIVIVACGTSYYAGLVGEYLIEEIASIPVEVQLASEFKYRSEPFSRSTALLAISQSGETADTIAALKKVEDYGVLRLGIVNAVGSTIARMTDAGVYCHAGPEQSVASTKAFIAQVTVLIEIALHLSEGRSPLYKPLLKELSILPDKVTAVLKQAKTIEAMAKSFAKYKDFLFIGRGYAYPCALEGALKLKELSYIHAEGYAAGEMKHGPLAMIDKDFPTFAIAPESVLTEKTHSNIEEIKARGGLVVAIVSEGNKEIARLAEKVVFIPKTLEQTQPLLIAIVLQLFAYYTAITLKHNVDRPRNLAKSVTVE
ncbi:glutamine--fructose-6-phosphate transaminase (isomerizing) [Candidatus Saccharibacteria bacterium]|nr:glutamine--fructose-6-phosphate transaminase (isomerizing) [Candidatus Saccharibacteria bacterium]